MGKVITALFPDKLLEKIGKLVERAINQDEKIAKLDKLLGEHKIKVLDSGTNRMVFRHKDYPNAVLKVAMDEQGVLDNLNEYEKSNKSKRFPGSIDIDDNGYVLVQKRWTIIESEDFEKESTKKEIRKVLKELSEDFVLIDLGMDKRKNFAYDEDGDIGVIDFGYVTYKEFGNFNCPLSHKKNGGKTTYCKGKLEYNKNYTMVKCDECGNVFKVDILIEGHCEHKYEGGKTTKESFRVTPSLQAFYESFNKYRDRESLTEYVKLNSGENNSDTTKGCDKPMNAKSAFLQMSSKYSANKSADPSAVTKPVSTTETEKPVKASHGDVKKPKNGTKEEEVKKTTFSSLTTEDDGVAEPYFANEVAETADSDPEYYVIGHDETDIYNEDEDLTANIIESRKRTIQRMIPEGVDGDEIISQLYLDRFPDMAETINSKTIIPDDGTIVINEYMVAGDVHADNPYVTINLDNTENPAAFPSVYIIKDGYNLTLDIMPQIEHIVNIVASNLDSCGDISRAGIISYVYAESIANFDGNYESRYIPQQIEDVLETESGENTISGGEYPDVDYSDEENENSEEE